MSRTNNSNPVYQEYDGQPVLNRTDKYSSQRHGIKWLLTTIFCGKTLSIKPLALTIAWCVASVFITRRTARNYEPDIKGSCRGWCTPLAIDGAALNYVGYALFLLTSFRVGEAYGKYMEAIRVWNNIGGTITGMAKYIVQAFPRDTFHKGDRERILSFLVAFPVALKRELRGQRDLRELKSVLAAKDLSNLQNASSMSSYCLYVLTGYALKARREESKLPQNLVITIIGWIGDLSGCAGACSEIKTTPAPYTFITHLHVFTALWLFFLPYSLIESTGWLTIPVVSFIGYGILGVISNATELEDPFGSDFNDLPLGHIVESIQEQVKGIYKSGFIPRSKLVCDVPDANLFGTGNFWLEADDAKPRVASAQDDAAVDINVDALPSRTEETST